VFCDFNHQVMTTKGGFICVFTDKRLHLLSK
jgi:ATP-dependent RNA circularization protein (DNA/RNA ligase family)